MRKKKKPNADETDKLSPYTWPIHQKAQVRVLRKYFFKKLM